MIEKEKKKEQEEYSVKWRCDPETTEMCILFFLVGDW